MDTPRKPYATAATVKVRNVAAIPAALRELGADPEAVLSEAGVPLSVFANPESALPYLAVSRLLAHCVRATGRDDFGLRVGALSGPPSMGLTGLVSVNSPTVREGIGVVVQTLRTSDTGGVVFLDVAGGLASFGYCVVAAGAEATDQIEDLAIGIGANILRRLCGPAWRPLSVCLAHPRPRDRTLFARFFDAPVHFQEPRSCLVFDAALLEASVSGCDPAYANVLAPLLEEAVASASGGFLSSVKSVIRAQVAAGSLSRDNVCRALGVNARTLAHRLGAQGVTYSSLADEARFDAARSLLLKDKRISEIAAILGFAEQSAFTRAFKAWSGATPARWRAERRRAM